MERETLLPFPRLRRFGTHYETGSKFLLLFSIKSKEEPLCFAKIVPNGRTSHVVQPPHFGAPAPNQCEALMTFAMGNCITLEDTNGNRKLLKKRREQKIDAVAAMMDAYVAYKANKDAFE